MIFRCKKCRDFGRLDPSLFGPRIFLWFITNLPSFGYGSIPIHTIFSGMNIHLPAILMFTRGTRFWHTAIYGCFDKKNIEKCCSQSWDFAKNPLVFDVGLVLFFRFCCLGRWSWPRIRSALRKASGKTAPWRCGNGVTLRNSDSDIFVERVSRVCMMRSCLLPQVIFDSMIAVQ